MEVGSKKPGKLWPVKERKKGVTTILRKREGGKYFPHDPFPFRSRKKRKEALLSRTKEEGVRDSFTWGAAIFQRKGRGSQCGRRELYWLQY